MIDLRSDTVMLPSDEMCEIARNVAAGDDVYDDGLTVNEFEARIVELVGREAALFAPSGMAGNQIVVRVYADPG